VKTENLTLSKIEGSARALLERAKENHTIQGSRIQSIDGQAGRYNERLAPNEFSFDQVYHDVWRIFFTPSQPVARLIQREMDRMELVPGDYAAAHLRALYGRTKDRSHSVATEWTRNALNCASTLRPGGPFLFSSDHTFSQRAALQYGVERNSKVVTRIHDKLPLHLEKTDHWELTEPSEFYDTFVDLYLMGMSQCVTFNRGGFGHWASLIGYNSTCQHNQKTTVKGIGVYCNWTDPDVPPPAYRRRIAPLFREPMEGSAELGQAVLT
jgi:hypothetical protein